MDSVLQLGTVGRGTGRSAQRDYCCDHSQLRAVPQAGTCFPTFGIYAGDWQGRGEPSEQQRNRCAVDGVCDSAQRGVKG